MGKGERRGEMGKEEGRIGVGKGEHEDSKVVLNIFQVVIFTTLLLRCMPCQEVHHCVIDKE